MDQIVIYGARQHNLKNITLSIPRNRLVVITGVSGSGKSSLAFDTLFAEGQRRYVESLSTFARQSSRRLDPPDVDEIQGLSPALAIEQKGLQRSSRSTVGTLTEIYDYLRLLYLRVGTLYCPHCKIPVKAYTIPAMIGDIKQWPPGSRLLILAPLGKLKESELTTQLKKLQRDGFVRIRLDGRVFELDPLPLIARRPACRLDLVVDRLILDDSRERRLAESLEVALKMGDRKVSVAQVDGEEKQFSEELRCVACGAGFPELTLGLFSFQHPAGMCPLCKGLGYHRESRDDPPGGETKKRAHPARKSGSTGVEDDLQDFLDHEKRDPVCPHCKGSRLNETARSVLLDGKSIAEASRLSVPTIKSWLSSLHFTPSQKQVAARPVEEMINRLSLLEQLGLAYLSLDRAAPTLSGGEAQRIRLANQIGNQLSGVLYVLDEPSIGLHPRDHNRLLDILLRLRDRGNSLVVVEHDRQTIAQADYVVDMGPGAGAQGGEVIYCGPPQGLARTPQSLTGLYLSGREKIALPSRRPPFAHGALHVKGASGHNLRNISVAFPLGCLTCVTGVSGSGKSTLVFDTLYKCLAQKIYRSKVPPAPVQSVEGVEQIQKVILVDQSPLGRTPRSIPATHTGLFSLIRRLFARLPESRARGYSAGRFSFNARGGRCEACKGEGFQTIDMFFLPDVYVTCPLCGGTRFNRETLDILFKGSSIADVLDMTVQEAAGLFENVPAIRRKLATMQEVGLSYLRLGQPATTLSGGEAQRVKLAGELSLKTSGKTLYILDEPTSGLHFDDIRKLLHVLQRLVDKGHTVIVIEHHLDVIKTADHIIDLGPEGGAGGGRIVVCGTPEEVAQHAASLTGQYLRQELGNLNEPESYPPEERW